MVKEESSDSLNQSLLDCKGKQAREVLVGMGLPSESVEQAVKKLHDFGGDLNAVATYALGLSIPQAECIEEHLSDDMISSDEDMGEDREGRGAAEEVWVDPICKIFQNSSPGADDLALACQEGEISAVAAAELTSVMVDPGVTLGALEALGAEAGSMQPSVEEPSQRRDRETCFLDMGFPFDLVQRAIRHHGLEADDSILLQFLIDYNKENRAPELVRPNFDAEAEAEAEESDSDEELKSAVRDVVAGRSLKNAGTSYRSPEDEGNDSGSEKEAEKPLSTAHPLLLCSSREIPQNGGHKAAMESLEFSPALIERAIQELGQGVEYDMLLEYLLYLSAQQDPGASTSGNPSGDRQDNTLEKLTTEFQFPTIAVEKAMNACKTPLWNASQEEIVDVIDFLAAHMEDLLEEDGFEGKINLPDSDEDDSETEDETFDWGEAGWNQDGGEKCGKRKIDDRGKELARSSWYCRGKGATSGGRPKIPKSISKIKGPMTPAGFPEVNKQKGAIGFGLPGQANVKHRPLKDDVKGAPFFYFENVAGMPVGEWARIQMHLFDIEPEFVDAMHFSACRRSRGYIHNLPIDGRKKIIKDPPMTIKDLIPQTKPFWPEWDKRTKLNCINTVRASEFLSKRLGIVDGTGNQKLQLSIEDQKKYMYWCCKLNLVWTSPNIPSPVEADEIEAMLGFDKDHTRHCFGLTARYKALGNSFSVFTVAYHFSVLKPLYPHGIKVLSLFSGIGGAEVALHKIGVQLNVVVSVEIEEGARRCLQVWWGLTKQKGYLDLDYHDVRNLSRDVLASLVEKYNGFDFIVGGSPCNNFTGNNRHTRVGLDGEHSTMFFEFSRIVATVRELTKGLTRHPRG